MPLLSWLPPRLALSYHPPAELTQDHRDQMWGVFQQLAAFHRPGFEAGIDAFDEVFLVWQEDRLVGFGGVQFIPVVHAGTEHMLLFTGRVALLEEARGHTIVARTGFRFFLRKLWERPLRPVWWFFGAASEGAYLVMARNFVDYWPHPERPWPTRERHLLTEGCRRHTTTIHDLEAGTFYLPGLVYRRLPRSDRTRSDPRARFYRASNPRRAEGHGLHCLAPLTLRKWLYIFTLGIPYRVVRAWWRQWTRRTAFRRLLSR